MPYAGGCHSHRLNSHSLTPYTKEWVESLLKFNVVNSQSPENQRGQQSNAKKSWSKFWPAVTAMTIEAMGVTPPAMPVKTIFWPIAFYCTQYLHCTSPSGVSADVDFPNSEVHIKAEYVVSQV